MSFLDSVLSSISSKSEATNPTTAAPSKFVCSPITQKSSGNQHGGQTPQALPTARQQLRTDSLAQWSSPRGHGPSPASAPVRRSHGDGTTMGIQHDTTTTSGARKAPNQRPPSAKDSSAAQPQAGPPSSSTAARTAPKKGSFAEVLARAQQAQAIKVGQITHKPREALSNKKEIALRKAMSKQSSHAPRSGVSKHDPKSVNTTHMRAHARHDSALKPRTDQARVTKSTPLGRKPTAQLAYQGTMKSRGSAAARVGNKQDNSSGRQRRLLSEEEEDDSDEGRYVYASDDYSDMEAGFDDVEEEDEEATRQARREDIAEQRRLDDLNRQKDERKRRLGGS